MTWLVSVTTTDPPSLLPLMTSCTVLYCAVWSRSDPHTGSLHILHESSIRPLQLCLRLSLGPVLQIKVVRSQLDQPVQAHSSARPHEVTGREYEVLEKNPLQYKEREKRGDWVSWPLGASCHIIFGWSSKRRAVCAHTDTDSEEIVRCNLLEVCCRAPRRGGWPPPGCPSPWGSVLASADVPPGDNATYSEVK